MCKATFRPNPRPVVRLRLTLDEAAAVSDILRRVLDGVQDFGQVNGKDIASLAHDAMSYIDAKLLIRERGRGEVDEIGDED